MPFRLLTPRILGMVAIAAVVSLNGCGGGSAPSSFTPAENSARQALEMSLNAWKEGKKPTDVGSLEGGGAIQVIDSDWAAGKKLKSFEIQGETAAAASSADSVAKQFTVRLDFAGGAPEQATYHVVGKDPLSVFRDKDFTQSQGM
jgi:hypothetical protein